jgi:hypothetical protein
MAKTTWNRTIDDAASIGRVKFTRRVGVFLLEVQQIAYRRTPESPEMWSFSVSLDTLKAHASLITGGMAFDTAEEAQDASDRFVTSILEHALEHLKGTKP